MYKCSHIFICFSSFIVDNQAFDLSSELQLPVTNFAYLLGDNVCCAMITSRVT